MKIAPLFLVDFEVGSAIYILKPMCTLILNPSIGCPQPHSQELLGDEAAWARLGFFTAQHRTTAGMSAHKRRERAAVSCFIFLKPTLRL